MQIAICEDRIEELDFLKLEILSYCSTMLINPTIDCYLSGEAFLNAAHSYDIVFMDIYLSGMNGMEAIKKMGNHISQIVVFTTISKVHAIEAFNVSATHYLLKPLTSEKIIDALKRSFCRLEIENERILEIKIGMNTIPIKVNSIQYIEIFSKISYIHTTTKVLRTYENLATIFEQLDSSQFMKAQRSFIVNMNYIESFYFDRIILINKSEVCLSKAKRKELKIQYKDFLFQLARSTM